MIKRFLNNLFSRYRKETENRYDDDGNIVVKTRYFLGDTLKKEVVKTFAEIDTETIKHA